MVKKPAVSWRISADDGEAAPATERKAEGQSQPAEDQHPALIRRQSLQELRRSNNGSKESTGSNTCGDEISSKPQKKEQPSRPWSPPVMHRESVQELRRSSSSKSSVGSNLGAGVAATTAGGAPSLGRSTNSLASLHARAEAAAAAAALRAGGAGQQRGGGTQAATASDDAVSRKLHESTDSGGSSSRPTTAGEEDDPNARMTGSERSFASSSRASRPGSSRAGTSNPDSGCPSPESVSQANKSSNSNGSTNTGEGDAKVLPPQPQQQRAAATNAAEAMVEPAFPVSQTTNHPSKASLDAASKNAPWVKLGIPTTITTAPGGAALRLRSNVDTPASLGEQRSERRSELIEGGPSLARLEPLAERRRPLAGPVGNDDTTGSPNGTVLPPTAKNRPPPPALPSLPKGGLPTPTGRDMDVGPPPLPSLAHLPQSNGDAEAALSKSGEFSELSVSFTYLNEQAPSAC